MRLEVAGSAGVAAAASASAAPPRRNSRFFIVFLALIDLLLLSLCCRSCCSSCCPSCCCSHCSSRESESDFEESVIVPVMIWQSRVRLPRSDHNQSWFFLIFRQNFSYAFLETRTYNPRDQGGCCRRQVDTLHGAHRRNFLA